MFQLFIVQICKRIIQDQEGSFFLEHGLCQGTAKTDPGKVTVAGAEGRSASGQALLLL